MKLSIKGKHCSLVAENPDEPLSAYWRNKLRETIFDEITEFLEEVGVALRRAEPGTTVTLQTKPIVVTITAGEPEPALCEKGQSDG